MYIILIGYGMHFKDLFIFYNILLAENILATTNLWKTTTTTNPPIISPDATPATTSRPTNSKTTGSSNPIVTQSTANSGITSHHIADYILSN